MTTIRMVPLAIAAVLAIGGGGAAFAATTGGDAADLAAISTLKVNLPQAIAAAEQSGGGKAVSADLDMEKGKARILVELASAQGVKHVAVDAQTGQVSAVSGGDEED